MTQFAEAIIQSCVTYDDLIGDLVRYGSNQISEADWRTRFPTISDELIVAAASTADECPMCLARFIYLGPSRHKAGCALADVLGPGVAR